MIDWAMQPVLDHLRGRLPQGAHALVSVLFQAISIEGPMAKLDASAEWCEAEAAQ